MYIDTISHAISPLRKPHPWAYRLAPPSTLSSVAILRATVSNDEDSKCSLFIFPIAVFTHQSNCPFPPWFVDEAPQIWIPGSRYHT